ncbi:hypothetical protein VTI74DRAFT_5857 [Chaetomium olivicolor]
MFFKPTDIDYTVIMLPAWRSSNMPVRRKDALEALPNSLPGLLGHGRGRSFTSPAQRAAEVGAGDRQVHQLIREEPVG